MAENSPYRTDAETVEHLYDLLQSNRLEDAVRYLKTTGDADDATAVARRWIGAQCDLNNVKGDPRLSEVLARPGVEYALENGLKKQAAILLHNILAFHAKEWDENVDPRVVPGILEASRRQVALRAELPDRASYGWSLWDLGMSELIAGNAEAAVSSFAEAEKVHLELQDRDAAAWARLFSGKALVRFRPDLAGEGRRRMSEAAKEIVELGEDWERAEIPKILASAGIPTAGD